MTYPVYSAGRGAGQISGAPLIKLKFGNLITDINISVDDRGTERSRIEGDVQVAGLLGWVDGITMSPDLETGFYDPGESGNLYPMLLNLSCNFNVLHQHKLGWEKHGDMVRQRTMAFPYGEEIKDSADDGAITKAAAAGPALTAPTDFAVDCSSATPGPDGLGAQVEEKCNQAPNNTPQSNILESIVDDIFGGL